jgi:hypothetical protein
MPLDGWPCHITARYMCVFQEHVPGLQARELPPTTICFACAPMYLHTRRSYTLGGVESLRCHRSSCCSPHVVVVEIEFLDSGSWF